MPRHNGNTRRPTRSERRRRRSIWHRLKAQGRAPRLYRRSR